MKYTIRYTCTALVAAGALLTHLTWADDEAVASAMDPQMAEMMKNMEEAGTPGAAHKALEPFVGDWNAEVKTWMAPGAPPTVTKATVKVDWILGGRFVQEEFNGEFMGKPFRGLSLTGYDNTGQQYNNVWLDDMHTAVFMSEGSMGKGGKVLTLEGKFDCALTGQKGVVAKQVIRIISRDKRVFEMYENRTGSMVKGMEITYTRK